jgi:hypothetical protein
VARETGLPERDGRKERVHNLVALKRSLEGDGFRDIKEVRGEPALIHEREQPHRITATDSQKQVLAKLQRKE